MDLASGNNSEAKDRLKDTAKYLTKKLKLSIIQVKLFGALSSIDDADHSLLELIDDSDNESELEVELNKILKEHRMLIEDEDDDH